MTNFFPWKKKNNIINDCRLKKIFHFPLLGTLMLFIYYFLKFFVSSGSTGPFSFSFLFRGIKENVKKKEGSPCSARWSEPLWIASHFGWFNSVLRPYIPRHSTLGLRQRNKRCFSALSLLSHSLALYILLVRFNPPFCLLLSRFSQTLNIFRRVMLVAPEYPGQYLLHFFSLFFFFFFLHFFLTFYFSVFIFSSR